MSNYFGIAVFIIFLLALNHPDTVGKAAGVIVKTYHDTVSAQP